jgi:methionine-gamma-lyase
MPHINTLSVHAGDEYNPTDAIASPIYQTSTWRFDDPAALTEAARSVQPPRFYNRCGSPNTQQAEAAIAALCGAEAALVSGSGMGTISSVLLGLLRSGDHVVGQRSLYPGALGCMNDLLPRLGIEVTLVDQTDPQAFAAAMRPETRLIYTETPSNPILALTDLAAIAEIGRAHNAITVCDNTFATPYNQKPLALGIDLEVHSATKYLAGHSDVGAGVVAGSQALIAQLYPIWLLLGPALHAQEAWLLQRGLKTFGLRMAQHNRNGEALARFLAAHPAVTQVYYPGLETHPQHALARAQMPGGFSGMVCCELAGGRAAGLALMQRLHLFGLAVSLGGVHSLVTHPAGTIAAALSDAQLAAAGISPGLVRISVGIEDSADLIADFEQAFA